MPAKISRREEEASQEFYRLLAKSTGNQLVIILNEALATIMRPYVAYVVKSWTTTSSDIAGGFSSFSKPATKPRPLPR